jgi:leucyl aminopeptidase
MNVALCLPIMKPFLKLQDAGDSVGRLWQLPLWDVYKQDIESDIADVKNYSGKPVAGAISAAKFLEYFTKEHWAHLDVAGVAFGDDNCKKQTCHGSIYTFSLKIYKQYAKS